MMKSQSSVHRKLLFLVPATTTLALAITGAAMILYDLRSYRQIWIGDLTAQADMLGLAAVPALELEDPGAARAYLEPLAARPDIIGAAIYTATGAMFARYTAGDGQEIEFPKLPALDGTTIAGSEIALFKRIVGRDEILGAVYVRAHYGVVGRLLDYLGILGAAMALSLLAAVLISRQLQKSVMQPIRETNAELEERVAACTADLEVANKDLEGFSYSVSHDLRAPIRAISGFCSLLVEDHAQQLDAEARRKLDIIGAEAARMGRLIDDLLAFSRLGRKALEPAELDMAELARGTFERVKPADGETAVDFRLGSMPRARGDRSLLEQVWINLLSNAVKFSSGMPAPVIEAGGGSGSSEVIYFVRDNGAGFDGRYADRLFGVFQRLHGDSEFPGNGVGLALVHKIVTRHGGRVWAEGKPGEGATFHFTLPKGD